MGGIITQLFPPKPTFTEKNVPSLIGKVFIVTGGNSGVGLELVKILYSRGGTVYIASRSTSKIDAAIATIRSIFPNSSGKLKSLHVDLNDLRTISVCASTFLAQESRLDVLWNNAGIAQVPAGSITAQGHEAHMGVNCLGPFLLTTLLLPILLHTAKASPTASVRVVFTSSSIVDIAGPPGGLLLSEHVSGNFSQDKGYNYSASKAGNWLLASEFGKRTRNEGLVCVTQNVGQCRTDSWNQLPLVKWLCSPMLHDPIMGAYTELWAGLSPDVKCEDGGKCALPWGRWHTDPRKDILQSMKSKEEGGTGLAAEFWDWCEQQTEAYAAI
jgi:NAD(P)-dependent dehydrogenase (short-subunit alcohol dehydrogenase family)